MTKAERLELKIKLAVQKEVIEGYFLDIILQDIKYLQVEAYPLKTYASRYTKAFKSKFNKKLKIVDEARQMSPHAFKQRTDIEFEVTRRYKNV